MIVQFSKNVHVDQSLRLIVSEVSEITGPGKLQGCDFPRFSGFPFFKTICSGCLKSYSTRKTGEIKGQI